MVDKKQLDDTKLEYYWLNEEDIENLKSEKIYTLEEVEKADRMQEVLEQLFFIKNKNFDIDVLLDLYDKIYVDVQSIFNKASR